jgi:hypothetical protein
MIQKNKTKATRQKVFYGLASEVTYCHFYKILLLYKPVLFSVEGIAQECDYSQAGSISDMG